MAVEVMALKRKNMLTKRVNTIPRLIDEVSRNGFITIEASTESNRESLDLAGLR